MSGQFYLILVWIGLFLVDKMYVCSYVQLWNGSEKECVFVKKYTFNWETGQDGEDLVSQPYKQEE